MSSIKPKLSMTTTLTASGGYGYIDLTLTDLPFPVPAKMPPFKCRIEERLPTFGHLLMEPTVENDATGVHLAIRSYPSNFVAVFSKHKWWGAVDQEGTMRFIVEQPSGEHRADGFRVCTDEVLISIPGDQFPKCVHAAPRGDTSAPTGTARFRVFYHAVHVETKENAVNDSACIYWEPTWRARQAAVPWMRRLPCDCVLVVPADDGDGVVKIPAHREVLAEWSPVFQSMLCSDTELTENVTGQVDIVDFSERTVRVALDFLYNHRVEHARVCECLIELTLFADKYNILNLEYVCAESAARMDVCQLYDLVCPNPAIAALVKMATL